MTRRILVTRPEPGASETAVRLERLGFEPVILPLTRIVALPCESMPDPDDVDAVVVTSANAIRHAPSGLIAALSGKAVFTVGDATARAARDAGFLHVRSAEGTARDLVVLLRSELLAGARILHLAGRQRTEGFAEAVADQGYDLRMLELYEAEIISYSTDFLFRLLGGRPLWGALVMSTRAGMLLADLAAVPDIRQHFEKATIFCISRKAATPLESAAGLRTAISDDPTEEGILRLVLSQA